jgi:regulatory subunit for Cdc7p protein kinase
MAATVFIPPSPHDPFRNMSATSRRPPLASIPNATNSPHRLLANSGSKRPRSLANFTQQEDEPSQKRLMVERSSAVAVPPISRRQALSLAAEGRVFERENNGSEVNAFQKKLVAAREKGNNIRITKNVDSQTTKDVESIRQWQKHYRRIFPQFNFYFESVPEDARTRFARQVTSLGAVCRTAQSSRPRPCSLTSIHVMSTLAPAFHIY